MKNRPTATTAALTAGITTPSTPVAGTIALIPKKVETPAPIVVLVEPQLGENIGAAARAMANFGLPRLRWVKPQQGWPNERARVMAAGADRILDGAVLYDSLNDAIGDCNFVLAATARNHDQAKPVISADAAAAEMAQRVSQGENVARLFDPIAYAAPTELLGFLNLVLQRFRS